MAPTMALWGRSTSAGRSGRASSSGCCDTKLPFAAPVWRAYLDGRTQSVDVSGAGLCRQSSSSGGELWPEAVEWRDCATV